MKHVLKYVLAASHCIILEVIFINGTYSLPVTGWGWFSINWLKQRGDVHIKHAPVHFLFKSRLSIKFTITVTTCQVILWSLVWFNSMQNPSKFTQTLHNKRSVLILHCIKLNRDNQYKWFYIGFLCMSSDIIFKLL